MESILAVAYYSVSISCLVVSVALAVAQRALKANAVFFDIGFYLFSLSLVGFMYAFLHTDAMDGFARDVLLVQRMFGICASYGLMRLVLRVYHIRRDAPIVYVLYGLLLAMFAVAAADLAFGLEVLFLEPPPKISPTPLFRYVYVPFSILGLIAGVFISLDLFPVVIRQDPFADILWVYGIGMSAVLSAAVMFVIRFIAAYAPRTARKALVLGDPQQTTRESDGEEAYLGLVTVIKERRLFADPEVTLQDVARESGLPRNEVSRLINVYSGGNFRALVNRLRVEEMKRLLAEGELSASILEIAIEVGFNSKT
ncbi:MAG: helix-turn-helix domain-containing protein, partial [Spirochaetota bacterium]